MRVLTAPPTYCLAVRLRADDRMPARSGQRLLVSACTERCLRPHCRQDHLGDRMEYDECPAECTADTLSVLDHLNRDRWPLAHGEKVLALAAHRGRAGRCTKQRRLVDDEPRARAELAVVC